MRVAVCVRERKTERERVNDGEKNKRERWETKGEEEKWKTFLTG